MGDSLMETAEMAVDKAETPPCAQAVAAAASEKELLCPICMQIIKDAFLTACGHSFCYMCIVTHLQNKSDCPCCAHFLTTSHLFPNFLLDKLLKKKFVHQWSKSATPFEQFRQSLEQGCEVTIKELDALLVLVSEKKRVMEQEEAERNMQFLLDFLHCLRKQKVSELNEVQHDLQYIKEDINAVERHRIELYRARDRYSGNLQMISYEPMGTRSQSSLVDRNTSGIVINSCDAKGVITSVNFKNKKEEKKAQVNPLGTQSKDASFSGPTSQHISQSGLAVLRKKRVHAQFNDLQDFYLQTRRQSSNQLLNQVKKDKSKFNREGYSVGLVDFQSVLNTFTRYSRLRVIAELRHEDLFHHANIVSSIEFDRDDELFATAGVSRRIKVFDFSSVKVWCTNQEASVLNIDMKANICCVKYSPESSKFVAVGSADHHIHYYDLRNTCHPLHIFGGHKKTVSHVKFLSNSELASASTDNTLRLWDVKNNVHVRAFRGHTNEKNFVGLTGNNEFLACGSETNEVFVYHKAISRPATWHRFGSPDLDDNDEDAGSYFISAVCWKSESPTMLAANSKGTIKVLVLAA
ncbi:E3 ubiquitin-protein ligase COP1-like isoform X2 [Henckelia pumila]|uniref:E3 ubiquitin-protein ligase COP1-like isoform X2 n=1 Tax=Henckelia pumila TaxID=405737 RepID=UPI003C6E607A